LRAKAEKKQVLRFAQDGKLLILEGRHMATATESIRGHKRVDIKRNDTVKVITGRDKGKEGRVLRVFPAEGKILVEHVMMVKKHVRPNPQRNVQGGIAEQESRVAISNVQLVCPSCGPVRIGHEVRGDRKVRVCRKCGNTLDKA
jgi:large subunit ribosomal protein L24